MADVGPGGDRGSLRERTARLKALDARIARLEVPFDEWETVYRERLQVERDLRAADAEAGGRGAAREVEPTIADRVIALGTAALIAADAFLLAADLSRSRRRR